MLERMKHIKEQLMTEVEGQVTHLECVDACELGEVVDMIKDLEEAAYYHTITKAMQDKEESQPRLYYPYDEYEHRDRDKRYYNKMTEPYQEKEYDMPMHDHHEGRSGLSRKTYMEAKEMHEPKTTQMRELEKYLQELSSDIAEMIEDASPEEKTFMEKKISALAAKINV